jgi:hypothetical protein
MADHDGSPPPGVRADAAASTPCLTRPAPVGAWSLPTAAPRPPPCRVHRRRGPAGPPRAPSKLAMGQTSACRPCRFAPRPGGRCPSRTSTDAYARCGVGSLERRPSHLRAHRRRARARAVRACELRSPAPRAPRERPRPRRRGALPGPHPGRAVARPVVPLARAVRPCLEHVLARLPGPRRRSSQTPTAPTDRGSYWRSL